MQHFSFLKKCRQAISFSSAKNITNEIFNLESLKKVVSLSLLTALMIPMLVFGQSAQRPDSNDSSLVEASKIAPPTKTEKENSIVQSDVPSQLEPEGSPCGWTAAPVSPIPILDQGTVTVGTNLYTFAGVSTAIIATANKFDGTTWSSIAPVPVALEYPTAVSSGTAAYIINGVDGTGTSVNTIYRYNPGTNDYTTLAPSAAATSSWNAAGAYLNGKIYKIGGYHSAGGTTTSLATVEIYDIATNTWSTGAPYPAAQGWESAFVQGNFIYVAGGLGAEVGSVPSTKTYRYDPVANTWDDAAIADLPLSRWGAASSQTVYNGGWVLAGGYVNGTAAANLSAAVTQWNPTTNTWGDLPSMLQARSRMTGAVLNGAFHVIGGRSSAGGFGGTNDNQRLFCIDPNAPFLQGSVTYVSDNGNPVNNVPDPGETVTVSLTINNIGGGSTGTVTATLQNTGGITNPTGPAVISPIPGGGSATRNFTFQVPANAVCGSTITLTFNIADGATNYTVTKTYSLGVLQVSFSQNFDGVTAPALPAGWTSTNTAGGPAVWVSTTAESNTAPNSVFTNDPAAVGESSLESPAIPITSANAQVNFRLHYNTEFSTTPGVGYDGAVLEIKIGAGAYQDILAAGGSFVSNGYNRTIDSGFMNPLAGRQAWSGDSATYLPVTVNLPAAANGQSIQLKWRMGSDSSVAATGVNLDTVTVSGGYLCSTVNPSVVKSRADFDGDGKTDYSVFRPSEGNWYLSQSTAGFSVLHWGASGDVLTPGDFDNDGKADYAVFRPNADSTQPDFYILNSNGFTFSGASWGLPGDVPLVRDYDGDGKADVAVYRPSNNTWYILKSGGGATFTVYGQAGDVPVPGDYDNDGKADLVMYRSGTWVGNLSGGGTYSVALGAAGDLPVPADYDGDNKDDCAVFRPSTGQWYVVNSGNSQTTITPWGASGDVPVPGDYDGDGKDDYAIYRGGQWWVLRQTGTASTVTFGVGSDTAIPKAYIP